MKSEHRHDLKTNELGKLAQQIGVIFEEHGNKIVTAACVVMVVAAVAIYLARSSNAAASAGWTELAAAQTAEDYANIADNFEGTVAGTWARLSEAKNHLSSGIQLAFTDRKSGTSDLKKAKETFEKVLASTVLPAAVRERALFGLARCLETMSDGNTDAAVAAYEKLLNDFPNSTYKEFVEKRADILKTGRTQEFYAWFHKQNPKPADRETPQDGLPAGHPTIDSEIRLPEIPEQLLLPKPVDDGAESEDSTDNKPGPELKPQSDEKSKEPNDTSESK